MLNTILKTLGSKRIKTIAYAHDVAVLLVGKGLQIISDIMKAALKMISTWAGENGLGVNPENIRLIRFTRKYKVPRLIGKTLVLSNEAKYLEFILHSKVTSKRDVEEQIKKGIKGFLHW